MRFIKCQTLIFFVFIIKTLILYVDLIKNISFQEISKDELRERLELVKKLKSELKNEEMALVLLKKLKQSQQMTREVTSLGGGATLTATKLPGRNDPKNIQRQNSANELLNSDKLVSIKLNFGYGVRLFISHLIQH